VSFVFILLKLLLYAEKALPFIVLSDPVFKLAESSCRVYVTALSAKEREKCNKQRTRQSTLCTTIKDSTRSNTKKGKCTLNICSTGTHYIILTERLLNIPASCSGVLVSRPAEITIVSVVFLSYPRKHRNITSNYTITASFSVLSNSPFFNQLII
jgi:hypothetical protein